MKKQILLLVAMVFCVFAVNAQQLTTPMNFVVNSPASVAGQYDYGYQSDWGPTTLVTTCGDLAWGYTAAGDSLGCTPIVTDLTGKIAVISRGGCSFSLKAYHAEQAGAIGTIIINAASNATPNAIVNMSGGDSASAVTTPAVFLPYDVGSPITNQMVGGTVNACFYVPQLDDASGLYSFSTPVDQIRPLDIFRMVLYDNGTTDETNVVGHVKVIDPSGIATSFSEPLGTISAGSSVELFFTSASYTPSALGTYTIVYTATSDGGIYANDSIVQNFEITPHTYSNANNATPFAVRPATYPLRYDVGSAYYPTTNGVATHVSFGLEDVAMFHGEPMDVFLYETKGFATAEYGDYDVIGYTSIVIDSTKYSGGDTMVIALDAFAGLQNDLIADSSYLVVVSYDASVGNGVLDAPGFLHTAGANYEFIASAVYTTSLSLGGWTGGQAPLVRLRVEKPTGVRQVLTQLEENTVNVFPNPATQFVNLDLNFDQVAQDVNVKILDMQGRQLQDYNYTNIQSTKITYGVDHLPAGNYFIRVETEKGFRTTHFIVMK